MYNNYISLIANAFGSYRNQFQKSVLLAIMDSIYVDFIRTERNGIFDDCMQC